MYKTYRVKVWKIRALAEHLNDSIQQIYFCELIQRLDLPVG